MEETADDSPAFGRFVLTFWKPTPNWSRLAIAVAWIICSFLVWHAAALFNIPQLRGFDGSLFCDSSAAASILVVAVMLIVCTLLGTVIAGAIEFEAGFYAATLALAMVSLRSGTVRSVIFETGGTEAVYYKLAGEAVVLGIFLGAAWIALCLMEKWSLPAHSQNGRLAKPDFQQGLAALGTQLLATGIFVCILAQSETKKQAIAAVFVSSIVGGAAAFASFPTKQSYWYWAGPVLLGIIGYLIAATGNVGGIANGNLEGMFAALARPLPIDYVSVGPAGAILGCWMAKGWNAPEGGATTKV
jgi:hypothetical protein